MSETRLTGISLSFFGFDRISIFVFFFLYKITLLFCMEIDFLL